MWETYIVVGSLAGGIVRIVGATGDSRKLDVFICSQAMNPEWDIVSGPRRSIFTSTRFNSMQKTPTEARNSSSIPTTQLCNKYFCSNINFKLIYKQSDSFLVRFRPHVS